ncbi:MAG: YaiI/YqxD family protein [Actinomycetota bacterium]|nr:YaiI/YqxD family protein [Actinomycetota bacterium]
MTTLFIDADACPVTRDALSLARSHKTPVVLVGNTTQNLGRYTDRPGVEAIQVGAGRDAADFVIIEELSPDDIVVTADIGLAAMVLGRGARAVSHRGRVFSPATIDMELAVRHAEQQHRRAGGRTGGPSPFEEEDRERFVDALRRLLREDEGRTGGPR